MVGSHLQVNPQWFNLILETPFTLLVIGLEVGTHLIQDLIGKHKHSKYLGGRKGNSMQGIFFHKWWKTWETGQGGGEATKPKPPLNWRNSGNGSLTRAQWRGWGVCRIWTHFDGSSGCWSNRARQLLDTQHQEEGGTETPISPAQPLVSTSGPPWPNPVRNQGPRDSLQRSDPPVKQSKQGRTSHVCDPLLTNEAKSTRQLLPTISFVIRTDTREETAPMRG